MKKLFLLSLCFVAAAALSGCDKGFDDYTSPGELVEVSVSASLSGVETRMSVDNGDDMNGSWAIGWESGDATSGWASDGYLSDFGMEQYTDEDNATFSGTGKTGNMRLVYPQVTAQQSGELKLDLSSQSVDCQTSQHSDFGGKSLYMVSDKFAVSSTNPEISNLQMNHLLTYVELRVTNSTDKSLTLTKAVVNGVQSEAIVAFDDLALTGSGESITIEVANATTLGSGTTEPLLIPFSTLPTTFKSGDEVTIDLYFSEGEFARITKSITEDLEFAVGTHNYFTCDVSSTTETFTLANINAENHPSSTTWIITDTDATAGSATEFAGLLDALYDNGGENYKDITVVFPNLTTLPSVAFNGFPALTSIELPKVTSIATDAFKSCSELTSIELPEATEIGVGVFYNCAMLTSIELPKAITIGDNAFQGCTGLTSIELPEATTIGNNAFESCSDLTSIELPEATTIGDYAFKSCSELTSIKLPKATTIESYAFKGCTELTSIELPEATTIGSSAFNGCSKLTSIELPEATTIGSSAFNGCSGLTSIELPKATTIGGSAFWGCSKLTSIDLPEATKIEDCAFWECSELTSVDLPKATSLMGDVFYNCSKLTSIELSEVQKINANVFMNCSDLTSIELPKVTDIGDNAFEGCSSLTTLKIATELNCSVSTLGDNLFGDPNTISMNVTLTIDKVQVGMSGVATISGNTLTVGSEYYIFKEIIDPWL